MNEKLRALAPLLAAAASVAAGDPAPRALVEAALPRLEQNGWRITAALERIWQGERDLQALTETLEPASASLVYYVLALADGYASGARELPALVLAGLPGPARRALAGCDVQAFRSALAELPLEQAVVLYERVLRSGLLYDEDAE
jgi:hypothetical protein